MDNCQKTWLDPSDRRGIADDLPPPQLNKSLRGNLTLNGRSGGAILHAETKNDKKIQLHQIEQKAYSAVLFAFSARSNTITWEQASLLAGLKTELRVTDEEHKELLCTIKSGAILSKTRELTHAAGLQSVSVKHARPELLQPISAVSAKQKSTKSTCLSLEAPIAVTGAIDKKIKSVPPLAFCARPNTITLEQASLLAGLTDEEHKELLSTVKSDAIVPNIRESMHAVGLQSNMVKHARSVAISTPSQTLSSDAKVVAVTGAKEMGTTTIKNKSKKYLSLSQNGISRKRKGDEIEILHSETLLVELEKVVFSASHPHPHDIKKAKKALVQHEQSLIDAIQTLADFSDGESD